MMLLETIKAGIRNSTSIRFPGTDTVMRLRILSPDEKQNAQFATERRFIAEKCPAALHTLGAYEEEKSIQMLFMALSTADGKESVASSVNSFRALLTTDELDALIKMYEAFEQEINPGLDGASEEQIEALVRDVKKKPDEVLGSVSSIAVARRLLRTMVSQLPT